MDPKSLLLLLGGVGVVAWLLEQSMASTLPADDGSAGTAYVDPQTGFVFTTPPDYFPPDNSGGYPVTQQPAPNLQAKISQFVQAVAHAEGFGQPGAVPTTHHNPGDLGPGDCPGFPFDYHSGSNVCQLPDDATGWNFLTTKITNAFTGRSAVYSPNMTILQFARSYAGNWQDWANNVAGALGVTTNTVIADWLSQ